MSEYSDSESVSMSMDLNEGDYSFPMDEVKDLKVIDECGTEVPFGPLVANKKVILFFTRNFA